MKVELPVDTARRMADRLADRFRVSLPFDRVAVAGSVRRGKPLIGDIELVARIDESELLGHQGVIRAGLEELGIHRGAPNKVGALAPWGPKYYKGIAKTDSGDPIQIDLFVVVPGENDWGVVFLIRTGSARFSQEMVTRLHRFDLKSEDGRIVSTADGAGGTPIPTPEEEDFFRHAHVMFIPPHLRDMENAETRELFRREDKWPTG
jgi:DNA polymerase/3'-5' exonuclease PolX